MSAIRVVLPTGLGDCHWCVQKLRSLKEKTGAERLIVEVAHNIHHQSSNYLKLIPFVDEAREGKHLQSIDELKPHWSTDHWSSLENCKGWKGYDYVLCANGHLESGKRIEEFLPELETDYAYTLRFQSHCAFPGAVVLYPSGVGPNTGFHGNWWTHGHWARVIEGLSDRGITPVVVGAATKQDQDYARQLYALPGVREKVIDLVGKTSTDEVLHLISKARFWTGLNSGLGILSAMMGTPTAMHWSIKPFGKLHPNMRFSWLEAKQLERYRAFAYGDPGFTPDAVLQAFDELA